jgi:tRNA(Ile)-lysidine synthase
LLFDRHKKPGLQSAQPAASAQTEERLYSEISGAIIIAGMLNHIDHILQQICRIDKAKPVLAGVSGGPDSLALLDAMDRLGYRLIVAHFNHRLRAEAEVEAKAVQQEAEIRGLQFRLGEADVRSYADENMQSIEEAGRHLRYRFLFREAEASAAQAVVVAHTADDQVETVLMHLLRGAGLDGLKGMPIYSAPNPWSAEVPLVRPLLDTWREEIEEYCRERGLKPFFDLSNRDPAFFRSRIRTELIPTLETYSPSFRLLLSRTIQLLGDDHGFISERLHSTWSSCLIQEGSGFVALDRECLLAQPVAIRRRLIRLAVSRLRPGLRDIGFELVERAITYSGSAGPQQRKDLGSGLSLLLEGGTVWLAAWEAELPAVEWPQLPLSDGTCQEYILEPDQKLKFSHEWELDLLEEKDHAAAYRQALHNPDPFQAWIDPGEHPGQVLVRCRKAGDRFSALGMDGRSLRLSDFMINVKMPRRARQAWPLVCLADQIAWVPGYQVGHPFRLKADSVRVYYLRLARFSNEEDG